MTTPRDTFYSLNPVREGELVYMHDDPIGYAMTDAEPIVGEGGPGYVVDVQLRGEATMPELHPEPRRLTLARAVVLLAGVLAVAIPWWVGIARLFFLIFN